MVMEEQIETTTNTISVDSASPLSTSPNDMLLKKLHKISENFDIASITIEDISEKLDIHDESDNVDKCIVPSSDELDIPNMEDDGDEPDYELDIMLSSLMEDFKLSRRTFKTNINSAQQISENINRIIMFDGDVNPEQLDSYANIINVVNTSTKHLVELYKEILKIKKDVYDLKNKNKPKEDKGATAITKNYIATSTLEIIQGNS